MDTYPRSIQIIIIFFKISLPDCDTSNMHPKKDEEYRR